MTITNRAGYHVALTAGVLPAGFHTGPPGACDDPTCHGTPDPADPAGDLERMAFDLATGSSIVMPGTVRAAIDALASHHHARGQQDSAEWLLAEYTGPGTDQHVRRAADRLHERSMQIKEGR